MSERTKFKLKCSSHEMSPSGSLSDQGRQLLCSKIHCHVCTELNFSSAPSQLLNMAGIVRKAFSWDIQDSSVGLTNLLMALLNLPWTEGQPASFYLTFLPSLDCRSDLHCVLTTFPAFFGSLCIFSHSHFPSEILVSLIPSFLEDTDYHTTFV